MEATSLIKWKEEYRVGVALIDQQHQKLFEIANRAYNLLADEWRIDKYDDIIVILEELRDYALFHFSVEEEHMKKIGYQRFLSHKVEHDDFKEELNAVDLYKLRMLLR
jgi:hemerythrin